VVRPKSQELPRPETESDLRNKLLHLMESFDNRFSLGNPRFIERYIKMELHILLKFRHRDSANYIAGFQNADGIRLDQKPTKITDSFSRPAMDAQSLNLGTLGWRHAMGPMSSPDSKQKAVFVDSVKVMETPERVIPTFVWFDCINSVSRFFAHSLYFSSEKGRGVFLGTICNRKVDVVSGRLPSCSGNKMTGEMIQGTSEVVEGIGTNDRDIIGNVPHADEIVAALSGVRIVLGFDYIRIGIEESITGDLQILDMLVGPVDFC
jgi:hypothetical protein